MLYYIHIFNSVIGHTAINMVKTDLFFIQYAFDKFQLLQDIKHNATNRLTGNNSLPFFQSGSFLTPLFIQAYRNDHYKELCRKIKRLKTGQIYGIENWANFQHVVLSRSNWLSIDNGKIGLQSALQCWLADSRSKRCKKSMKNKSMMKCKKRKKS